MKKITIEVSDQTVAFLELLCDHGVAGDSVESVVVAIVASIVDGMRRPGSWERQCVAPMFGEEWADELEPSPDAPWQWYPKGYLAKRERDDDT